MEITTPSGMVLTMRPLKGKELAALAADDDDDAIGKMGVIVGGCWESTIDPGPYPHVKTGDVRPDLSTILKGDMLYLLLRMRALSMRSPDSEPGPWGQGDRYWFPVRCENPSCPAKNYEWEMNLSDLTQRALPADSAKRLRAGESFYAEVDGVKYTYVLQTAKLDPAINKLRRQQKRTSSNLIDVLTAQTVDIDACPGARTNIGTRYNYFAECNAQHLFDLSKIYGDADCGTETKIDVKHSLCRHEQEVELPLVKGFLAPRPRYKSKDETL